jgi:hypothetical protein
MPDIERTAAELYEEYCARVGGEAWDHTPLPTWEEFRADPDKRLQSNAWVAVARLAYELIGGLQFPAA